MLWIAVIRVNRTYYMNDNSQSYEEHQIVWADDYSAANKKIEDHYKKMTDEYSVYYNIDILELNEVID